MPRQAALKLGAMTVSQLVQLRDRIQTALSRKLETERDELQRKINALSSIQGRATASKLGGSRLRRPRGPPGTGRGANGRIRPLKGRTVTPKYRDPANPSQTWAGRGLAPRWLAAYETQGRKRAEFLIGARSADRSKSRKRK